MKLIAAMLVVLLSGCASLSTKVYDNIHEGDSADKVRATLGPPDEFGASQRTPGAEAWYYHKGDTLCGITVNNNAVAYRGCQKSPPQKREQSKFARLAKAFGDGASGKKNVSCTTVRDGNSEQTDCRY